MRTIPCLLLLYVTSCVCAADEAPTHSPLQMTASVGTDTATHAQPIVLKFVPSNTSDKLVRYVDVHGTWPLKLIVTGPNGKPVEPTAYGKWMARDDPFSAKVTTIDPGEKRTWYLLLSRYCDLSMDGTYKIQIGRDFQLAGEKGVLPVLSNVVELQMKDEGDPRKLEKAPTEAKSEQPTK